MMTKHSPMEMTFNKLNPIRNLLMILRGRTRQRSTERWLMVSCPKS